MVVVSESALGIEMSADGKSSLCLFPTDEKPAHLHLAFVAENRGQVEAFHRAALEAGATDNGAPGLRPNYSGEYYAAFVIGPDGHNIEVVCHGSGA
jgi:catechol 2,3-dioxygenase-like lactoylglutathione lyase family enzyme